MSRYKGKTICPECKGSRLKKDAQYVKINDQSINQLVEMPISSLINWFEDLSLTEIEKRIADRLLTEIKNRLTFLINVGLEIGRASCRERVYVLV